LTDELGLIGNLNSYPRGIKVSDEELASVNLEKDKFHGEWNYTIIPRSKN